MYHESCAYEKERAAIAGFIILRRKRMPETEVSISTSCKFVGIRDIGMLAFCMCMVYVRVDFDCLDLLA